MVPSTHSSLHTRLTTLINGFLNQLRHKLFWRWSVLGLGLWCLTPQYFSYIVAISFICGGNRSIRRKPQTCRKSLTNFKSHNVLSSTPRLSGIGTHNFNDNMHWLHMVVVNPTTIRSWPQQPRSVLGRNTWRNFFYGNIVLNYKYIL